VAAAASFKTRLTRSLPRTRRRRKKVIKKNSYFQSIYFIIIIIYYMVTRLKRSYKSLDVPIYNILAHAVSVQYIHHSTAYYVYKYTYNSQYAHILYFYLYKIYKYIIYYMHTYLVTGEKTLLLAQYTCITHAHAHYYFV